MIRCSPDVAQTLGLVTTTAAPAESTTKPAGCGCGGACSGGTKPHSHGAGLTFVVGALVGAILILAIKA